MKLLFLSKSIFIKNVHILFIRINNMSKKEKQARLSIKKVCKDLDIASEDDLNILIAHANYLKPGFSHDLSFQS